MHWSCAGIDQPTTSCSRLRRDAPCYCHAMAIKTLDEFLAAIPNGDNRARMAEVLDWVAQRYPELELRIA